MCAVSILLSSCQEGRRYYYSWIDFNIEIIDNSTTFGQEMIYLDVNNPIAIAKLGIRIRPVFDMTVSRGGTFSIGSCPRAIRLHNITSIVIKTISENADAGIDVSSLFKGRLFGVWQPSELSIVELIELFSRLGFCGEGFRQVGFDLLLRDDSIDLRGKHIFEITITFDDGVVLVQETEELELV